MVTNPCRKSPQKSPPALQGCAPSPSPGAVSLGLGTEPSPGSAPINRSQENLETPAREQQQPRGCHGKGTVSLSSSLCPCHRVPAIPVSLSPLHGHKSSPGLGSALSQGSAGPLPGGREGRRAELWGQQLSFGDPHGGLGPAGSAAGEAPPPPGCIPKESAPGTPRLMGRGGRKVTASLRARQGGI